MMDVDWERIEAAALAAVRRYGSSPGLRGDREDLLQEARLAGWLHHDHPALASIVACAVVDAIRSWYGRPGWSKAQARFYPLLDFAAASDDDPERDACTVLMLGWLWGRIVEAPVILADRVAGCTLSALAAEDDVTEAAMSYRWTRARRKFASQMAA